MDDLEARLRAAVRQQADSLTPNADLPERIHARVAQRRRRQRVMAGALATAAVVLVAFGLVAVIARPSDRETVEVRGDEATTTVHGTERRTTSTAETPTSTTGPATTEAETPPTTTGPTTTTGGDEEEPSGGPEPPEPQETTTTEPLTILAAPDSETPAAGTCATPTGAAVEIVIHPDIPAPRCARVTADQHLQVRNASGQTVTVSFANFSAELAPGATQAHTRPFGEYLQPGVHRVSVSLYGDSGPEIWLQP